MEAQPTPGTAILPPNWESLCLALTEHAPLPMVLVEGASHTVRYANPAFCRLMDKPMEQLAGRPFCELLPEGDIFVALLDRILLSGKPESHTELIHAKPHSVFWSCAMWPLIADEMPAGVMVQVTETARLQEKMLAMNEALMLGSVRQHKFAESAAVANAQLQEEISERKQAQEALHRAQAQLRDRAGQLQGLVTERTSELTLTNSQLEAFIYSIAHDLRAPLRAMQGFSSLLVEEAGSALNERGRDYAGRINKSAQFMDALLTDLLVFSRISQRNVVLTSVNLKPVVESVLDRLQTEILEKKARIESPGPWPAVMAHEPTLAQVLFNLVSNALKFVAPGVTPVVRLLTEEQAEFTRVWVEDNGLGIAPQYHDEIFRLFTRLGGETYAGTGVGLAIVQKGVERMGGRAGVQSASGQGSRFWFQLKKA